MMVDHGKASPSIEDAEAFKETVKRDMKKSKIDKILRQLVTKAQMKVTFSDFRTIFRNKPIPAEMVLTAFIRMLKEREFEVDIEKVTALFQSFAQ